MRRSLLLSAFLAALAAHAQFGPPRIIEETETYMPITALADLDGDGDNDLLSLSSTPSPYPGEGRVAWYANDGGGNFGPEQLIIAFVQGAYGLEVGDIDGDGDADVLTSRAGVNGVFWFENDGLGSFIQHTIPSTGDPYPCQAHSLVDLDDDGDLDAIGETFPSIIKWYENDGTGDFGPEHTIDLLSSFTYFTAAADIDGDGDVDMLTTESGTDGVYWFANDGSGNFGPEQTIALGVDGANHCTAADLDGDGDQDVLSAAFNENTIAWYENDGAGNFGPQQIISSFTNYAKCVASADLDGDGDLDVLSASSIDSKIAWYKNNGDGGFGPEIVISTTAYWAWTVSTGDADGDGDLDVFSTSWGGDKIAWYENLAPGFGPQKVLTVSARTTTATLTADLDGDNDPDVLVGIGDSRIAWYENLGGGLTGPQQEITSQLDDLQDLRTADLDGDGDQDLLSATYGDQKFAWYANDGSGGFGSQQILGTVSSPRSVCPADLDGDGDQDVLGGHGSGLERYMNDGFGNFTPFSALAGFHKNVHFVDVDGDGDGDCLSTGSVGVVWAPNDGLGSFSADQLINVGGAYSVTAADLDGDGDQDVIFPSSTGDTLAWYANDGFGEFGPQQVISLLVDVVYQVLAGDIDADGDQDVLSASYGDDKIAWYRNDGSGVFGPQLVIDATVAGANCLTTTDMDGDSDLDVIGAGYDDPDVVWYENHVESPFRIEGTVFMDADLNGAFGGADAPFPFAPVSIMPMLSTVMSGASGSYTAFVDTGSFVLESVLPHPLWTVTTVPQVQSVQVTALTSQVTGIDFGWAPAVDTSIVLPGFTLGSAPCGGTANAWLSYVNQGTRTEQGTIALALDPQFTFLNSDPPPSLIVGNSLTWDFDSLGWFEMRHIAMVVELPTVDSSGLSWTNTTTVTTVDSLGNTTGVFAIDQSGHIGCAYDPNDKQVEPQGYGTHGAVPIDTEWLTYIIRFQNTGTDTAYNVIIVDQLDADLDRSSLQILGTSHGMTSLQVDADGEAIFRFNTIMLPDSNVNVAASQGYLRYRIRPVDDAADGTLITNTASIIFDFNPAIITNTVANRLVDCELFAAQIHWQTIDALMANAGDHFQWYFEGDSIDSANSRWLFVTEPGNYTVEVTNVYGCVDLSDPYQVIITGIGMDERTGMMVAPNPTTGHVTLTVANATSGHVMVHDARGTVVQRTAWPTGSRSMQLDLEALENGIYLVELITPEGRSTARVVQMH